MRGSVADGIDWPVTKSKDDPSVADPMRVSETSMIGLMRARTSGCLFDFPTEAEWEYACRAGTSTAYYNGLNPDIVDKYDAGLSTIACYLYVGGYNRHNDKDGNYVSDQYADPAVNFSNNVGAYLPNAFGLYDMLGNVSEHCRDWYAEASASPVVDPKGADTGTARVTRGGAWNYEAGYARAACRNSVAPNTSTTTFGFRLALYLND
jgi:formylglycine-generating enzyme required for sulfatase activity